eukprot:TRINITY_DN11291_c0_g1_i1.p1 TRINITY_DN11291_c0_g1~~TRINITY_DN11291_c0_g1_i1.p1  ORF type:complete len:499 (+),score=124.54 TRINITY_DN11291_c0_g1_i1:132-1628(+)
MARPDLKKKREKAPKRRKLSSLAKGLRRAMKQDKQEAKTAGKSNEGGGGKRSRFFPGSGEDGEAAAGPKKEPPTLFVRHVPMAVTEDALRERFVVYGDVRRCLLVMDRDTGRPNGNAFIHFAKAKALRKCLRDAQHTTELEAKGKPAGGGGPLRLYVQGAPIEVMAAVDRNTVSQLAKERQNADKKEDDPRNLYLLREGVFLPNTPATKAWPRHMLEEELRRQADKRRQLRNPNYQLSKTRLCVRHIPASVDEEGLRRIFSRPVTRYIRETTGKERKSFAMLKNREKDRRVLRQVKLCRDDQKDGKSRGFGFVQFEDHNLALVALRSINNNPTILGDKQRLLVEFAVDKVQALKILERRKLRAKLNNNAAHDDYDDFVAPQPAPAQPRPTVYKLQEEIRQQPQKKEKTSKMGKKLPESGHAKGKKKKSTEDPEAGENEDNDVWKFANDSGEENPASEGSHKRKRVGKKSSSPSTDWAVDAEEFASSQVDARKPKRARR